MTAPSNFYSCVILNLLQDPGGPADDSLRSVPNNYL